jgi:hypothetical protein
MSVSTEVQRTLVKSPPELWAELSSPEALSRHLGELGEIRITQVEPETKVEWETEGANGVVHLKPSGWGTRVTLSVTRIPPAPSEQPEPAAAVEPEPETLVEPKSESEPTGEPSSGSEPVADIGPEPVADIEPLPALAQTEPELTIEAEPEPVAEVEVELEAPATIDPPQAAESAPQPGFFARLFRRRRTRQVDTVQFEAPVESEPEPVETFEPELEFEALAAPEPIYPEPPAEPVAEAEPGELTDGLAAELEDMEAQMAEQTTQLLTGVLDRLGAAHHRPFSRG